MKIGELLNSWQHAEKNVNQFTEDLIEPHDFWSRMYKRGNYQLMDVMRRNFRV